MKLQAKLDKVIQEKTELKTKLTEVSKQLKDKSASNEELEKRQSQMDEEKEDYRKKAGICRTRQDEVGKRCQEVESRTLAGLVEKLKSVEDESQTIKT